MEIRTALIACAIVACSAVFVAGMATYKYTSSHYQLIIKDNELKQTNALAEANGKVVIAERSNNETTSKLNAKALEYDKVVSDYKVKLDKYRTSNNGLLVRSSSCKTSTGTPDTTPNSVATGTSTSTGGVAELDRGFATLLSDAFAAADTMRGRLLICQEYAESINAQRERLSNDNKQ